MPITFYCFIAIWIIGMLGFTYFGIRNSWVYRVRTDLIQANFDVYRTLPEYGFMIRKWWIWDASRFIGMKDEKPTEKQRAAMRGNKIIKRAERKKKIIIAKEANQKMMDHF